MKEEEKKKKDSEDENLENEKDPTEDGAEIEKNPDAAEEMDMGASEEKPASEEEDVEEPAPDSGTDVSVDTPDDKPDEVQDPDERSKSLDEREKALNMRELRATAIEELAKEQLPAALADCFNYESVESYQQSKDKVVKAFQTALKESVNNRLRGSKVPGEAATSVRLGNGNARRDSFSDIIKNNKTKR